MRRPFLILCPLVGRWLLITQRGVGRAPLGLAAVVTSQGQRPLQHYDGGSSIVRAAAKIAGTLAFNFLSVIDFFVAQSTFLDL